MSSPSSGTGMSGFTFSCAKVNSSGARLPSKISACRSSAPMMMSSSPSVDGDDVRDRARPGRVIVGPRDLAQPALVDPLGGVLVAVPDRGRPGRLRPAIEPLEGDEEHPVGQPVDDLARVQAARVAPDVHPVAGRRVGPLAVRERRRLLGARQQDEPARRARAAARTRRTSSRGRASGSSRCAGSRRRRGRVSHGHQDGPLQAVPHGA